MRIIVLGAAAGGGFPQWNCNSEQCRLVRNSTGKAFPRTQSSIAVTADGKRFALLNCSPDLWQQINQNAPLHPREGLRSSPIKAVILTNGDVDHIAGLLTMRESTPFRLYASDRIHAILRANPIFKVLDPEYVKSEIIALSRSFELADARGESLGLEVEAFAVPGKVPLFMEDETQGPNFGTCEGDTVGLHIRDSGQRHSFYYIPACAGLNDDLKRRLDGAKLLFFDGTLFRDDEMVVTGAGRKTGARMGHMSMAGEKGSLSAFRGVRVARKIYIHVNNTNPVLIEDSPERKAVEAAGWEVSRDGQCVEL